MLRKAILLNKLSSTLVLIERVKGPLQESMETKTDLLKDVSLQLSPSTTVAEMQVALGDKLGWAPAESAVRCCCPHPCTF